MIFKEYKMAEKPEPLS